MPAAWCSIAGLSGYAGLAIEHPLREPNGFGLNCSRMSIVVRV